MSCLKPKQKQNRIKIVRNQIKNLKKRKSQTESLKFRTLFTIASQISHLEKSIPELLARAQLDPVNFEKVRKTLYDKLESLERIYDRTKSNFNNEINKVAKLIKQHEAQLKRLQNTKTC